MHFNLNYVKLNYIILTFLILSSCSRTKEDVYDELRGSWAIHNITYYGENYKNHIFSMNIIKFKDDYSLSIPEIDHYKKEDDAKWDFNYENEIVTLIIASENDILNDTYKAHFFRLESKDKLILESEKLYLELYKF